MGTDCHHGKRWYSNQLQSEWERERACNAKVAYQRRVRRRETRARVGNKLSRGMFDEQGLMISNNPNPRSRLLRQHDRREEDADTSIGPIRPMSAVMPMILTDRLETPLFRTPILGLYDLNDPPMSYAAYVCDRTVRNDNSLHVLNERIPSYLYLWNDCASMQLIR